MANKLFNEKVFKEAHKDLIRSGTSKIGYNDFCERQVNKNKAQEKKAFDDRRIKIR